jgi:hypothetical protein
MKRALTLLLAALAVPMLAHAQQIYRWVDRDGVVHYADQPGAPDAKPVEYASKPAASSDASEVEESSTVAAPPSPQPRASYTGVSITAPEQDQVFFGGDDPVDVIIDVAPELQNGDRIAVFLDGKRLTDSLRGSSYQIPAPARGSHFVRVAVLDSAGKLLQQSDAVTFHVRQRSVARPPVGPALRPPPKKKP